MATGTERRDAVIVGGGHNGLVCAWYLAKARLNVTVCEARPVVGGAKVEAKIVGQGLGEKIIIFKFRRRKNYRRKTGHRQPYTALEITNIVG